MMRRVYIYESNDEVKFILMNESVMPESGAAHRAIKDQVFKLNERLDSTITLFEGNIVTIEGRLETIVTELSTKISDIITKLYLVSKPLCEHHESSTQSNEKKFDELQDSIMKIRDLANKT